MEGSNGYIPWDNLKTNSNEHKSDYISHDTLRRNTENQVTSIEDENRIEYHSTELGSDRKYANTFCMTLQLFGGNKNLTEQNNNIRDNLLLNTEGNDGISSTLIWFSSRLDSIEDLLSSIVCPSR